MSDLETRQYRLAQFERLDDVVTPYETTIKFIKPDGGETNWMNITEEEFDKIKIALTT